MTTNTKILFSSPLLGAAAANGIRRYSSSHPLDSSHRRFIFPVFCGQEKVRVSKNIISPNNTPNCLSPCNTIWPMGRSNISRRAYSFCQWPISVQLLACSSLALVTRTHREYATDHSKVERTLALLEEELLEKEREKCSRLKGIKKKSEDELAAEAADSQTNVLIRKVWRPMKNFCVHTWSGFKLLGIDIWITSGYCWRLMKGQRLSRREWKQLKTCVADIFRIVPFSVFILVPLGELLIPFYMKLFPFMLPSTFKEFNDPDKDRQKIVRKLQQKTAFASFLQNVQEELAMERVKKNKKKRKNIMKNEDGTVAVDKQQQSDSDDRESMALEFARFMKKVRAEGSYVTNNELLKYTKLFENELTLDNLAQPQLRALCGIVGIPPAGTPDILRFQLRMKLRTLAADDEKIVLEGGVDTLTIAELQQANRDRGMRGLGVPEARLKAQLKQWLELSLDEKVPPSLLLLSRSLYLPETSSFTDRLKSVFADLPESIAEETRLKISELETGQVDYKARLELVQRVQRALKEERKLNRQAQKETEEKAAKKAEKEKARVDAEAEAEAKAQAQAVETVVREAVVADAARIATEKLQQHRTSTTTTTDQLVDTAPTGFKPTEPIVDMAKVQKITVVNPELAAETVPDSSTKVVMTTEPTPITVCEMVKPPDAGKKLTLSKEDADVVDADLTQLESVLVSRRGVVDDVKEGLTELKEAYEGHQDDVEELNLIVTERFGESAITSKAAKRLNKRVSKMISSADKMLEKLEKERILAIQQTDEDSKSKELVTIVELIESLSKLQKTPDETQMDKVRQVLDALDDNKDGSVNVGNALEVIALMGEDNVKISAKSLGKILKMLKTEGEMVGIQKYRGFDPIGAYIYSNLRKVTSPNVLFAGNQSSSSSLSSSAQKKSAPPSPSPPASSSSTTKTTTAAAESSHKPSISAFGDDDNAFGNLEGGHATKTTIASTAHIVTNDNGYNPNQGGPTTKTTSNSTGSSPSSSSTPPPPTASTTTTTSNKFSQKEL